MTDDSRSGSKSVPPSPRSHVRRLERLLDRRAMRREDRAVIDRRIAEIDRYLAIADDVEGALDKLSETLFGRLADILEQNLTTALHEVLEDPIRFKVERRYSHGAAAMRFRIERDGHEEDVLKGQGGSVLNVLSVCLRMFALKSLDEQTHRRVLILDEPDCWLRPELVPRLVGIIQDAGRALGFQVILISHHDIDVFRSFADKIYRFTPTADGVSVTEAAARAAVEDRPE